MMHNNKKYLKLSNIDKEEVVYHKRRQQQYYIHMIQINRQTNRRTDRQTYRPKDTKSYTTYRDRQSGRKRNHST